MIDCEKCPCYDNCFNCAVDGYLPFCIYDDYKKPKNKKVLINGKWKIRKDTK